MQLHGITLSVTVSPLVTVSMRVTTFPLYFLLLSILLPSVRTCNRHDRPFTVSMANSGPGTNGSQVPTRTQHVSSLYSSSRTEEQQFLISCLLANLPSPCSTLLCSALLFSTAFYLLAVLHNDGPHPLAGPEAHSVRTSHVRSVQSSPLSVPVLSHQCKEGECCYCCHTVYTASTTPRKSICIF